MRKKVLITGISGFAGSHLAEHLVGNDEYEIVGTYLTKESLQVLSSIEKNITLHQIDLTQGNVVNNLIAEVKPDLIYHLAALSSPAASFKDPIQTLTSNIVSQVEILEAMRKYTPLSRLLIISSAEIYGAVPLTQLPINEEVRFSPTSPYAVSKLTQDMLGLQYFTSYKIPIIRARSFNHIGTRQTDAFVVPSFAKKIAQIEKGIIPPVLHVGNLDSKRDFTDVRDVVIAYDELMKKGEPGEAYNIGSGKSYAIREIVNKLINLTNVKITLETNKSLLRPSDIQELRCDNTKIYKVTGWKSKITLDVSLQQILDYWRDIV